MKTIQGLVARILLACAAAWAQETNPFSGTWHLSMVSKKGEQRKGKVLLTEQGGTRDTGHQVYKDPCKGIRAPIEIRSVTADEPVFGIMRSKSLRGCADNVATLKRIDDRTLQGVLNDGRMLNLTRDGTRYMVATPSALVRSGALACRVRYIARTARIPWIGYAGSLPVK